jgi:hypothetical protein
MRCDHCQRPIEKEYVHYEKGRYHRECFQKYVAPRCSLCGKIIEGKLLRDYWGNIYHPDHTGKRTQCDYCSRFISEGLTGGGVRYADGRRICGLCHKTAIQDEKKGKAILKAIAERLERYGIEIPHERCGFHLVDRDRLARISRQSRNRTEETGYTHYQGTMIDSKISSLKIDVYILSGLPKMHLVATAAHEIMHVWQYLNAPLENDRALCEGSCNYASYLILKEYQDGHAAYLIDSLFKSKNRLYGEGFRRIRRYVERRGLESWLAHLRRSPRFPRL